MIFSRRKPSANPDIATVSNKRNRTQKYAQFGSAGNIRDSNKSLNSAMSKNSNLKIMYDNHTVNDTLSS